MSNLSWITLKPEGLYCLPGRFYLDPTYPVDAAIITHGHSDHARFGHTRVLATSETLAIMNTRYDMRDTWQQALTYHQPKK